MHALLFLCLPCFPTWNVDVMARTPAAILGTLGVNLCAKDSDAESWKEPASLMTLSSCHSALEYLPVDFFLSERIKTLVCLNHCGHVSVNNNEG